MTSEELLAQIEATKARVEAARARNRELDAETAAALKRQKLRRELERHQAILDDLETDNLDEQDYRIDIDADRDGDWMRDTPSAMTAKSPGLSGGSIDFGHQIVKGEYTWNLVAMSWLQTALRQNENQRVVSGDFFVDRYRFDFSYSPSRGHRIDGSDTRVGSVAIRSFPPNPVLPLAFRYSIFVERRDGSFVQWGETRDEVRRGNSVEVYGPDVHAEGSPPSVIGIFGLTHEQLLRSEWVRDNTLSLKFVLEVRPFGTRVTNVPFRQPAQSVDVPEPTLHRDAEALLEEASSSDVLFSVQGEEIHAHSQVLCARSEVLKKQLNSGMQESVSKMIMVEDCNVATFKSFLRFLYTDKLPTVADLATEQASQAVKQVGSRHPSQMEALWAVSHKYQVVRLQRWCEAQLCKQLSKEQVCSVLRQAHIFEATQLEKACLSYVRENLAEVLKLEAYTDLISKWPEIALKIQLFSTGVPEAEAATILQVVFARRETKTTEQRMLISKDRFQLLHVALLREYMDLEFASNAAGGRYSYSLERVIDDFILFCILVGNDFLPCLPFAEIGESGLEYFFSAYKEHLKSAAADPWLTGGCGQINFKQLARFLKKYAEVEDGLLTAACDGGEWVLGKQRLVGPSEAPTPPEYTPDLPIEPPPTSELARVQWYEIKFGMDVDTHAGVQDQRKLFQSYLEGLHWVMRYYFRGPSEASWSWYYPYYHAPMAYDLAHYDKLPQPGIELEVGQPFRPFQQLMAVLPSSSKSLLPACFQWLFDSQDSPILSFYPQKFVVDMDGVKVPWGGMTLTLWLGFAGLVSPNLSPRIPFIDPMSLVSAMESSKQQMLSKASWRRGFLVPNEGTGFRVLGFRFEGKGCVSRVNIR
ncbi:XRN1 [Symbiodinium sp. CCMP2592]|nr:XRN1 [Symbiodinium sp. CCMP2592]